MALHFLSLRIVRILSFMLVLALWIWILTLNFSPILNLFLIIGGVVLIFPTVWLGRRILDKNPTIDRVAWVTTGVHFVLMALFGAAIITAIRSHQNWQGWIIPLPKAVGWALVLVTSVVTLLTVINLALGGWGAPFAIKLSRRLAVNWMYAWTRNPMVLGTLACLTSLGLWFQSLLFLCWVLFLVTPAWLAFLKIYEERELEIRFGDSYLEYKGKTPMLWPRKPKQGRR